MQQGAIICAETNSANMLDETLWVETEGADRDPGFGGAFESDLPAIFHKTAGVVEHLWNVKSIQVEEKRAVLFAKDVEVLCAVLPYDGHTL